MYCVSSRYTKILDRKQKLACLTNNSIISTNGNYYINDLDFTDISECFHQPSYKQNINVTYLFTEERLDRAKEPALAENKDKIFVIPMEKQVA